MRKIRKLTGISQQQLADYLGVPRSQVAAAEAYNRYLPHEARVKEDEMLTVLQEQKEVVQIETENARQLISLNKKLLKRFKKCNVKVERASDLLERMQAKYDQYRNALQMTNELLAKLPDDEKNKTSRLVMQIVERKTIVKLKKCGVEEQGLLQLDIDKWKFEVARVEEMMK